MVYEEKPAFRKAWKRLTPDRKAMARQALERFIGFLEGGPKPEGLGLKKLKGSFWEIRTTIKDRLLFTMEDDRVCFVLIGNHDEIHRALKRG